MRHQIIEMNPEREVTLEICAFGLPVESEPTTTLEFPRPAVIICPGGGYEFLSAREADPVAVAFQKLGFNTFILRYSIGSHALYPNPVVDVLRAIRWVRCHSGQLGVDAQRVVVLGFSAGGHVCASAGTMYHRQEIIDAEYREYRQLVAQGIEANSGLLDFPSRPNAIVPCYGVFNASWLENPPLSMAPEADAIAAVGSHVPPAFVWTTNEDETVPPSQSLDFVTALSRHGVPFEYHHFAHGRHGLSTADSLTNFDGTFPENAHTWVDMCGRWLGIVLKQPKN